MNARSVLLVGGPFAGRDVVVLNGSSVIMQTPGGDDRTQYVIARIAGSSEAFDVGVPVDHSLDGDWIIRQLLDQYREAKS